MTDVEARHRALHDTEIELEVPAAGEYLSVLRTAAAGLAARMDFTLDDIEDLRIAVDEASSMLLAQANPGTRLRCRFVLGDDTVTFSASVRTSRPQLPSKEGFAWTVLTAVASSVDVRLSEPDLLTIELTRQRPASRG
ncbi:MAG: anti-sigma regulatory factor [Actinomycetota bacterium]|nr:anti-sigma regulatory factor [Actinomycetota bacterium]